MRSLIILDLQRIKLSLFFLVFCSLSGFSQSKNLAGIIEHNYSNYDSPVEIVYTAHVDHGSGDYEYSWNTRGNKWSDFSDSDSWTISFRCHPKKRPEQKVFCKVRDKNTGKLLMISKTHFVESCTSYRR